jgi:hypothetical protein
MSELKECPFCGFSATCWERSDKDDAGDVRIESRHWWVECDNWKCGCATPKLYVNHVEEIWNKRAYEQSDKEG